MNITNTLLIVIVLLITAIYLQNRKIKYQKYDINFLEWQAKEFSKLLDKNNIEHAWG